MIADQFGSKNRVVNNYAISDYRGSSGYETFGFFFSHSRPSLRDDNRWDGNVYEINHTTQNLDYGYCLFDWTSGKWPTNSSMLDNVITGSGTIDRAYWNRDGAANDFQGFNGNTGTIEVPFNIFIRND